MKTNKLSIPLSLTAGLIGLIACAVSCAKKSTPPANPSPWVPETSTNNSPAADPAIAPTVTNVPAPAAEPIATNASAAPVTVTNQPSADASAHAADPITATDTNLPGHTAIVDMPASAPVAPTNFYAAGVSSNNLCCLSPLDDDDNTNFFVTLRAGYDHMYHGDNNDSYRVSAKFYAFGDGLRQSAGKNGWLIPDASAEIASGPIAKPDQDPHPGSDDGLGFRADFTWPWLHWTSLATDDAHTCPFLEPMDITFGPTVNVGFDHLYNESRYRLARYAGVRLTFNRFGFIEYTVGGTDGLDSTRQQIVTELPFYQSRDGEVRYYLRGLWNHGASSRPDILEGGIFLEMPMTTLIEPGKWGDLIPFAQ
jgi:hypothetical protein